MSIVGWFCFGNAIAFFGAAIIKSFTDAKADTIGALQMRSGVFLIASALFFLVAK